MNQRAAANCELAKMLSGSIKYYDDERGYGFIDRDDGAPNVFVHARAVQRAGHRTLFVGDRVQFELGEFRGRPEAKDLRVL